jgi:hypothetical protein
MNEDTTNNGVNTKNPSIPVVQSTIKMPDLEEFEGKRAMIEGWEIVDMKTFFDPQTGDKLSEPVLAKKLKVFSETLAQGEKNDGETFPIKATAIFSLVKSADGNYGLSSHPQSNIQQFFRKLKVDKIEDIRGKYVTVTLDANNWLKIVY